MNLLTSTMPTEAVEATEATLPHMIAVTPDTGESGAFDYYGTYIVPSATGAVEVEVETETGTKVELLYPDQIEGTIVWAPGTDPALLYGYKQTIWDNAWFVGGLMVLGFALIVGALQFWFMRKRRLKERELATMLDPVVPTAATVHETGEIHKSPVPGVVSKVMVVPGQPVRKGQVLCVLETRLTAREDGVVSEINVPEAAAITAETPVVVIKKVNS